MKPELWLKEGAEDEPLVAPIAGMSSKETSYLAALQHLGIAQNTPAQISDFETAPCPSDTFHSNWARCPGNTRFDLKAETEIEI